MKLKRCLMHFGGDMEMEAEEVCIDCRGSDSQLQKGSEAWVSKFSKLNMAILGKQTWKILT